MRNPPSRGRASPVTNQTDPLPGPGLLSPIVRDRGKPQKSKQFRHRTTGTKPRNREFLQSIKGRNEDTMRSVAVSVPSTELASEMSRMRLWLDAHGLEPSAFRYRASNGDDAAVIIVEFSRDTQAVQFANAFVAHPQLVAP